MLNWDKDIIVIVFCISKDNKILEYINFVTINTYGIGINNLDIKLII